MDMRGLRRSLKHIDPGNGSVARAIESSTFDLSERGFTMLIVSCRRCNRWRTAMEIFTVMKGDSMREKGVRPNFYTYSSLISVCCSAGACNQAVALYREMKSEAVKDPSLMPDATVYDILIAACHREHRALDVVDLYDDMLEDCPDVINTKSILCAVEAFGDAKLWDRAFDMLDMLMEHDIQAPSTTYIHLLSSCAAQEDVKTAVEVFLSMQMTGICPDPITCHHMVRAAAAAEDHKTCLELVRSMGHEGVPISLPTFNCVSEVLEKAGLDRDVATALSLMDLKGN